MNVEALIEAAKKIDAKMQLIEDRQNQLRDLSDKLMLAPLDSPDEFRLREERNKLAFLPDPTWDEEIAELRRALTA